MTKIKRVRVQKFCTGKKLTVDSEKDSTDINRLVKSFTPPDPRQLQFFDTTELPDFREMQDTIVRVHDQFAALPSRLRERFNNDPTDLVEWLADPENQDEAVELGLRSKPETQIVENQQVPNSKPESKPNSKPESKPVQDDLPTS